METTKPQLPPMMEAEPRKEHHWLQRLVGEWTYEGESAMGPDQPRERFEGTESVRALGDLWILAEGRGEMPGGGTARTLMTLGYDPLKDRFVGTFVGSMMTHLWVYAGSLDAAGKALTLESEGPSFAVEGKTTRFRDVIELESDDHRVLTALMLGEDGKWHQLMTAHYRRER